MQQGTVKRITDKGFGFIAQEGSNEKDMFFHSSSVSGIKFNHLRKGQKVVFTISEGPKGLRAENVQLAND